MSPSRRLADFLQFLCENQCSPVITDIEGSMPITKERFEAAKSDRAELDQIIEQFRERLHRFIVARLKGKNSRIDVDDVLQETLLRSYNIFERVEWRGERVLFGWLCGISLHVIQEMERRFLRINNEMPFEQNGDESTPTHASAGSCSLSLAGFRDLLDV